MLGRAQIAMLAMCAMLSLTASPVRADAPHPLRVVATIEPLCMLARELGGERVTCSTLVPPGASPHAFEPRPGALAAVAQAQLLLRAGNGIDDWTARLANAGDESWLGLGPACKHDDPACAHFWLDPYAGLAALAPLEAKLAALDAAGRAHFAARRIELALRVFALDEEAAAANGRARAGKPSSRSTRPGAASRGTTATSTSVRSRRTAPKSRRRGASPN